MGEATTHISSKSMRVSEEMEEVSWEFILTLSQGILHSQSCLVVVVFLEVELSVVEHDLHLA